MISDINRSVGFMLLEETIGIPIDILSDEYREHQYPRVKLTLTVSFPVK